MSAVISIALFSSRCSPIKENQIRLFIDHFPPFSNWLQSHWEKTFNICARTHEILLLTISLFKRTLRQFPTSLYTNARQIIAGFSFFFFILVALDFGKIRETGDREEKEASLNEIRLLCCSIIQASRSRKTQLPAMKSVFFGSCMHITYLFQNRSSEHQAECKNSDL